MKRRLLLIAVLSAIVFELNAQRVDSTKSSNEILFFGHVIRIHKDAAAGYVYDIFYQNNLVIHQNNNPFTASPYGLKNREDAVKIAKWQIIHLNPANHQMVQRKQAVPMEVARQLHIAIN